MEYPTLDMDEEYTRRWEEYLSECLPETRIDIVRHNGLLLKIMSLGEPEIEREAIKQNWRAIEYVENQTPELWQLAKESCLAEFEKFKVEMEGGE